MPHNEDGFFHGIIEWASGSEAKRIGSYTLPSGEEVRVSVLGYTVEYEAEPVLLDPGDWEIRDFEVEVIPEELILTKEDGTEILGDEDKDALSDEVWGEIVIYAQRQISRNTIDEDDLLRDLYDSL